jgi:hypothetical protein
MFIAIITRSYDQEAQDFLKKKDKDRLNRVEHAIFGFATEKIGQRLDRFFGLKKDIEMYDKDGDGKLDKTELEEYS